MGAEIIKIGVSVQVSASKLFSLTPETGRPEAGLRPSP